MKDQHLLLERKQDNSPSRSTVRPIVCFQRFPALAILRNLLSPSIDFRSSGGRSARVELMISSADLGAPEK